MQGIENLKSMQKQVGKTGDFCDILKGDGDRMALCFSASVFEVRVSQFRRR